MRAFEQERDIMETLSTLLAADFLGTPTWSWMLFLGIVVSLLAFDLGVLHKEDREIGVRESLLLSAGYISAALLFGAWVWWQMGAASGMAYYTGFMIEKSLSMDNVFVIALIFSFFAIPRQYQHRVLFWGILGVIVLRAIMIGLGAALVSNFGWLLYVFGAFLVFHGRQDVDDRGPDARHRVQPHPQVPEAPHAGDGRPARQCILGAGKGSRHLQDRAFRHAAAAGAGADRVRGPVVRGGLRAGDLRDHHRPVHRLHQQHLRHPGPARANSTSRWRR